MIKSIYYDKKGEFQVEEFSKVIEKIFHTQIINSIVVIMISFILYKFIIRIFFSEKTKGKIKFFSTKEGNTYVKMTKSIIRYTFLVVTFLILLQINGVNVGSMLAGVGVISVIIAFAVQDALKDMVRGLGIITDKYYHVGDVIKYNNIEGKVLTVGMRTTKIEDLKTFNIISIANRNIEQVEVVSKLINIDIPVPYEVSVNEAEKSIEDILNDIRKIKEVEKCEYRGVNDLSDNGVKYQIKVYCNPIYKLQVRRDCLRCILVGLTEKNIEIPYTQIDIHQK